MEPYIKIIDFLLDEQQILVEYSNGHQEVYDAVVPPPNCSEHSCARCKFHKLNFTNLDKSIFTDFHCILILTYELSEIKYVSDDRVDEQTIIWV